MNVKNVSLYQNSCNTNLKNNSQTKTSSNIGFGICPKSASDSKISFFKSIGRKISGLAQKNKIEEGSTRIILFTPESLTVNNGDISLWRFTKVKGAYKTLGSGNIDSRAVLTKEGSFTSNGDIRVHDSKLIEGTIDAKGDAQVIHIKKIKGAAISGKNVAIATSPNSKNTNVTVTATKNANILCPLSDSTITAKNVVLNELNGTMNNVVVNAETVFINTNLRGNSVIKAKNITYGPLMYPTENKIDAGVKIITIK